MKEKYNDLQYVNICGKLAVMLVQALDAVLRFTVSELETPRTKCFHYKEMEFAFLKLYCDSLNNVRLLWMLVGEMQNELDMHIQDVVG